MSMRSWKALLLAGAVLALDACAPAPRPPRRDGDWVASWASPLQPVRERPTPLSDQTLRQMVRVSLGGGLWRIQLSNAYGQGEARIDDMHLALAGEGAAIRPGSDRPVRFGGARSLVLAPGESRYSDPVALPAPPLAELSVSLHATTRGGAAEHAEALDPVFIAPGDRAGETDLPGAARLEKRLFLAEIDAAAPAQAEATAVLGDSLTDGRGSTPGGFRRWTDRLAERLAAAGAPVAVANAGLAGNRLLHELVGPPATRRLDGDALDLPGVTRLFLLEGVNDIGMPGLIGEPGQAVCDAAMERAYRRIVRRAHARGIKVIGATIPPFSSSTEWAGFYSPKAAAQRLAVNQWIRTSGAFDAVVDFDAVLRDPKDPGRLRPDYDSGDHLHPSDAGYAAMGEAVDLRLLR
jgi:lysophospholipase L1-like esterase